jgi:hypothetical protein
MDGSVPVQMFCDPLQEIEVRSRQTLHDVAGGRQPLVEVLKLWENKSCQKEGWR